MLLTLTICLAVLTTTYAALTLIVAHRFTLARRVRPRPAPDAGCEAQFAPVHFSARGELLRLAAWFAEASDADAAVVLVHGRDACRGDELRSDTFALAHEFLRAGFSVLMLDLRGHGDSAPSRLSYGIHERRDVLGAVDYLLAQGIAPGRIGVLGASMGAVTALGAAAGEPAIGALVLDSAFCSFPEVARAQFSRLTRLPTWMMTGAMFVAGALTRARFSVHTAEHDMRLRVGRPTLVIHSLADPFVPVSHAMHLAAISGAAYWFTDSSRHLGSYAHAPLDYGRRTVAFFVDALRPMGRLIAPELADRTHRARGDGGVMASVLTPQAALMAICA